MKQSALTRAHAPEILKVLNREGFTSNRGLYKRVREETGDETSGNHNALSIMAALESEGLVTMPEVTMEALVMSSILDKFNVKAITTEIEDLLLSLDFEAHTDEDTDKVFYMRPWTGKIFSRYETPKAVKAPKAKKIETLTSDEVRARFKVVRINKSQETKLAAEGFTKIKAEKFPFTTSYVREI